MRAKLVNENKEERPRTLYVYVITNNISGKKYVGSRICYRKNVCDDTYFGSSQYLKEDIEKLGIENFSKEILVYCENSKDLLDAETNFILELNTLYPNGYNRFIPNRNKGFWAGMTGKNHSEEAKRKMRRPRSEEAKARMRGPKSTEHIRNMNLNRADFSGENNPMFGKSIYDTWVEKYGEKEANLRMKKSYHNIPKERKEKISKSLKGRFVGEKSPVYGKSVLSRLINKYGEEEGQRRWDESNQRRSISQSGERNHNFGKSMPANVKQKIRDKIDTAGKNNPMSGRKHSDETKRKIREKALKRRNKK